MSTVAHLKFDSLHIRPRFLEQVDLPADAVLAEIKKRLRSGQAPCDGYVALHHVVLRMPYADQHFWSPQMQFSVEPVESDNQRCEIRGLVGPQPAVWTLFVFIYSAVGIMGTFASLYGLSKWTLGEYSVFIWAIPVSLFLLATAYFASKFGQRLGHGQIETLSCFVEKVVNEDSGEMNC